MAEVFIPFEEAVQILRSELQYPEEKAIHFVKKFDKNSDGKLSASEFKEFKQKIHETKTSLVPVFQSYDKDGNGYVTMDEAGDILSNAPFNFPIEKILVLLKKFDSDGNGRLDIDEFANFFAEIKAMHTNLSAAFDELDVDGNGLLSSDELMGTLKEMFNDEETAKWMIKMFDKNNDGNIDKKEFCEMWTNLFG